MPFFLATRGLDLGIISKNWKKVPRFSIYGLAISKGAMQKLLRFLKSTGRLCKRYDCLFAMTSSSGRKIDLSNGKKCYPKNSPIESCKSWKNRYCQNTLGMKNFSTLTATSTTVKYKLLAWNDATGTKLGHIFLKITFFFYVSGGKIHLKIVNVWAKKDLSGFLKFLKTKILLIFYIGCTTD